MDDEAELCLGRTMIDQVGLEAAESAASETDIAGLPDEQRDAVVESLNNCVPARAIAKTVMSAIVGAATDTPEANELLACLTTELEGRAGDILRQRDPSAAGDEFTELIEACPSGVPVDEGIASALRQSGRSPAVVECVMSALAGQITFAEIASQNPEATQKLEAAVIQCDQAGG
ncbi:MAG TPA: hypothetical protein VJM33_11730 [Microthrixaceae bacterium]|nr:hypothetical protein [Microthrixaceae bacterium]